MVAGIVASLVLLSTGDDVAGFWDVLFTWPKGRNIVNILNATAILYISGVAAAIGFRMNLFNIGVEGQYRVATFAAAAFAGAAWLPGKLNTIVAILIAMVAGALWAGIAGLLRTTRGVSEVISTIMLNAISVPLVGYFLTKVGAVVRQHPRDEVDRRGQLGRRHHAVRGQPHEALRALTGRDPARRAVLGAAQPDQLRLRPPGRRRLRDRPRSPAAST